MDQDFGKTLPGCIRIVSIPPSEYEIKPHAVNIAHSTTRKASPIIYRRDLPFVSTLRQAQRTAPLNDREAAIIWIV
ncbi:MAG TPA: hypothetical protein VJ508_03650, partial [Saprospiraceae bacterium]|nr:hypothetical protein [Saprospiraceae bacterium]